MQISVMFLQVCTTHIYIRSGWSRHHILQEEGLQSQLLLTVIFLLLIIAFQIKSIFGRYFATNWDYMCISS